MKKTFSLLSIFFFLLHQHVLCVDIGSDTAPTRFETQKDVGDGDRVAGFASLEAGLRLSGVSVTGTFDSFFPVSGNVDLNCGTLVLDRDFIFNDVAQFTSLGDIVGREHTLEFSSSITVVPFDFNALCCESNCVTNNLIDWSGECDDVKSVDWSYDDEYIAIGTGGNSSPQPLKIYSFDGSDLGTIPATFYVYSKKIYVVRWHPSKDFIAVGSRSSSSEHELLILEFDSGTNTISYQSSINFGRSVYAVAWHPSGDWLAVGRYDYNNEIEIFSVDGSGNINSTPVETISLSGRYVRQEALDWDATGDHLVAGVKYTSGDTLLVYEFNDTTGSLTPNGSYPFSATVNAVDWNPINTNFIAAGLSSGSDRLAVLEHNSGAGTLQVRTWYGNDAGAPSPQAYSVDWSPNGQCLSVGWEESSSSAKVEEFQTFLYNFGDFSITPVSSINLAKEVEAVRWSHDGCYVAIGSDINQLRVYAAGCSCSALGCVTFSDLDIFLNNDVLFRNCCIIFDGESRITGRGNCLTMAGTCTFIVEAGASLEIKDLTFHGISDGRFYCTDNLSSLTFSDVDLVLDDDYSFTVGKFDVINDFHIFGEGHTFAYQSSAKSEIKNNSSLILENNITFSYDPPIASGSLISLEGGTSELCLNGATLYSTPTGLQLTKGIVSLDRNSSISSEATVEAEAIKFGDGVDPANDIDLQGLPAENVNITQGIVVFNNVG